MTARGHAEEAARLLDVAVGAVMARTGDSSAPMSPWDAAKSAESLEAAYKAAVPHALTALALALTDSGSGSVTDQVGWALDRATNAIVDAAANVSAVRR